ncbi:CHASE2 domain-containing protein [Desulfobacula phenolica]|uniref:Adenylate cyclase n=1 Tax=Desulfobacula phenolica TaxID=90732 RepID=A0A1H2HXJ7_9BACT|nr:adenylate/guanylate cyclase domain-containing protein [Desulfobacula phenolica]SDU36653.1 adenylate cyclase [Desulfobacula phenolica]
MSSRLKQIFIRPFGISLVVVFLCILAMSQKFSFFEYMELKTLDLRFQARGDILPGNNIALAVIDEKSLTQEGKWMWPRSKLATVVNKLSEAGAAVIAFDIVFSEPDEKSLSKHIHQIEKILTEKNIKNNALSGYLEELKLSTDNDYLLARAIQQSKSKIVLGFFLQMEAREVSHLKAKQLDLLQELAHPATYKVIKYNNAKAMEYSFLKAFAPHANIRQISLSSPYSGFFNIVPDPDGVIRTLPTLVKFRDDMYAPLSIKILSAYLEEEPQGIISDYGITSFSIGQQIDFPTDEKGMLYINYRGGEKTFPHLSVTDILNNKIDKYAVKDKIIIIGATAAGIFDEVSTPFDAVYPGPEIHANIIDMLLNQDYLYKPEWLDILTIFTMIVFGLGIGILLPKLGVLAGACSAVGIFAGYILFCQYLFTSHGWILNTVYPLAVILIIYSVMTAHTVFIESGQKRFIKNAFSTYLAPAVVKQLMDNPDTLVLGGEKRKITAFFSDIQSFTRISESLQPDEIVALLNEFLTQMTDIILKHNGTVDKFEGDAIIAFFGAPGEVINQEETACIVCLKMQQRLSELRNKWREQGKPELHMRIGMDTGTAVVGNMGSQNRMDYTMMGDTVNIAARLEGVNKVYGCYTLVSENTYIPAAANNAVFGREIDSVLLMGKEKPIVMYELIGFTDDIDDDTKAMVHHYSKALQAYRKQEWSTAIALFKKALSIFPEDKPSLTLLQRCRELNALPPSKNWNSAFKLTSK